MPISPALVQMTDISGAASKCGCNERGIRGRADNFIVGIEFFVEIVIDVRRKIPGRPLVHFRREAKSALTAEGLVYGNSDHRKINAARLLARLVEINDIMQLAGAPADRARRNRNHTHRWSLR